MYNDAAGNGVLEKYLVDSMGHNWSGGVLGGTYTDPNGPSASRLMADFFLGTTGGGGGGGDTTAPITTVTPAGGTYSAAQNVTLAVNESANTFYTTNGSAPTQSSPIYTTPILISANTTLRYFSVDLAGNAEALKQQVYVINTGGGGGSTATLTSIDGEDGYAGALVADGVSTSVHKVGDKGMFNGDTFRLLLSFNTASVPADRHHHQRHRDHLPPVAGRHRDRPNHRRRRPLRHRRPRPNRLQRRRRRNRGRHHRGARHQRRLVDRHPAELDLQPDQNRQAAAAHQSHRGGRLHQRRAHPLRRQAPAPRRPRWW